LDPADTFRCNGCYAAVLPFNAHIEGDSMLDSHPPPLPAYIADEELKKEREIKEAIRRLAQIIHCPHCEK